LLLCCCCQEEHPAKPEIAVAMESSGSEEDEDIEALERSLLPIPGTNANRFSLLLQDNRKSKKRAAAAVRAADTSNQTNKQSSPPPNKKKKVRSATAIANEQRATRSSCARQFVKAKIPVDIKYQAALDFFLGGVLFHSSNNELLDASLVDKYSVLLVALGGTWPGFLHALLIRCVDRVLLPSLHTQSEVVLLWIRSFLSRAFLGQLDNTMNDNKNNKTNGVSKKIAPLATLKAFEFPLNSLCDRCDAVADTNPAAAELGKVLADILGKERCANHGVNLSAFQQASPKTVSKVRGDAKPVAKEATSPSASTASMSLAAMEAFLAGGDAGASETEGEDKHESSSGGDDEPAPTPWVRCTTWDPCAIGTLPGFGA